MLYYRNVKKDVASARWDFGKSLNMSMLQSFFEIGCDPALFEGLAISEEKELCEKYMGQFPVISISLKGVNGPDYKTARALMCSEIGREALRFHFLLESDKLSEQEKETYKQLITVDLQEKMFSPCLILYCWEA